MFDTYNKEFGFLQFINDEKGIKKFIKLLSKNSLVVMEATGYYHHQLAHYLATNGVLVSVVNPLQIKRFIQMRLSKVKTDKSDAKFIYEYANFTEVKLHHLQSDIVIDSHQIIRLLNGYLKKQTAIKNKLKRRGVLRIT